MNAPDPARRLSELYDQVVGTGHGPGPQRRLVTESWRRSLAASVDPDHDASPVVVSPQVLAELQAQHPLRAVLPVLRQTLTSIADEAAHVMVVTDAAGVVLWREGSAAVGRKADRIALAEGAVWSEQVIGTNGLGTALAVDRPVRIHSTEHLVRRIQDWTCAAAPVHDPETGQAIGAVDVSGALGTLHPAMMALVTAAAQLAEGQLRVRMAAADDRFRARNLRQMAAWGDAPWALLSPSGRVLAGQLSARLPGRVQVPPGAERIELGDGREAMVEQLDEGYLLRIPGAIRRLPSLRLTLLGPGPPTAVVRGRALTLTMRRAEVLALLLLHPAGLTAEQLMLELYGDEGNPATVRAEMHRLRQLLGPGILDTKPYRIVAAVTSDLTDVQAAVRRGALGAALDQYAGALLGRSDAPALQAERDELDATLRGAVLDSGDIELIWRFAQTGTGAHDLAVFEALESGLPLDDPRHAAAVARRDRLAR